LHPSKSALKVRDAQQDKAIKQALSWADTHGQVGSGRCLRRARCIAEVDACGVVPLPPCSTPLKHPF
jgi:hypothetical protein